MTAIPALRLDGLEKRYGALHVTRGVSLEVRAGEIHALIGPNGAGKSTLVAQVSGQLAPDAGRIYLGGADVTRWPAHRRARAGLGRTFQVSSVFGSLSAVDNVQVALNAKAGRYSPWRAFRKGAPRQAAEQELAQRGFPCDGRPAQSLGYGTVREIELLMGLVPQPTVLLLDEPLAGLSHAEARNAIAALDALRGRVAMLLVEHDMHAVFALAERITVLVGGAVIASGTPAEIRQDPVVRAAYLGDS